MKKKNSINIMTTKDNENYIYYKNLLFRYLKENEIELYNQLKNTVTMDEIDEELTCKIPEHYISSLIYLSKEYCFFRENKVANYLIFLSKHTKPLHREMAKEIIIKKLLEYDINIGLLNYNIRENRNNLFSHFENTIFSDKFNKNIYEVANNSPIGLIVFYSYKYRDCNHNGIDNKIGILDSKWMSKIAKNIYYNNIESEE